MIELRPYQIEAMGTIMAALRGEQFALLQAATGAGKTIIFSELIRQWMTEYPSMRIAIAAHRQELITQARDKLLKVWPAGGAGQIGLACAGVGEVDTGRPVVIGSVQTLARRAFGRPIHLLIIDEAHRVPSIETGGQYHGLIKRLKEMNPELRVLGVTATPYRLGHGLIYGNDCKPGHTNLFPSLNYRIGLDDLVSGGHLAPWRAKEGADLSGDLSQVKITRGEYDAAELNSLLLRGVHIQSAVEAFEKYGESRDKVLIFAASIEHAQKLARAFTLAGHPAAAVHSKLPGPERKRMLHDFESGRALKVLVNVGILTEGWDSPRVNCVLMCRPTKAPALFVQMIGRGTRIHPDKKDLLVLDLASNFRSHGDPDHPVIQTPGHGGGEAPIKVCPECQAIIHASALRCPECGHQWFVRQVEEAAPVMTEIKMPPPGHSRVNYWKGYPHTSYNGHYMFLLELNVTPGGAVRHWLDIEAQASRYGQSRAHIFWWQFSGGKKCPATVREAAARVGELKLPEFVTLVKGNGFKKVKEFN